MKTRALTSLALAALAAGAVLTGAPQDGEFKWLTDLDAARVRAKDEGKPLLIVFR